MREKNYNLELVRMISFIFVIAIHVTNYYCRAWGKIPQEEYVFSLAVNVVSRMSVPCFLMISGALLLGREEPVKKDPSFPDGADRVGCSLLSVEYILYAVGI